MIKAFYELLDRLDRAQSGLIFRIVATVLGLGIVFGCLLLSLSGYGRFLPEAYRENIVSSTMLAVIVVVGVVWLNRTLTTAALAGIFIPLSLLMLLLKQPAWAQMMLGIAGLSILLTVSLQALRLLFGMPWKPLAIARLVLDEAIRLKVALIFIIALIVLIPLLAATLDPEEALRYRIQTFLSYGTGLSYGMLSVMTVFLATATVAFDQREKTIFQIVAKPVSRVEYLVGKWIGIMGLNLVLMAIVAGSVFWFVQYLRTLPADSAFDRLAVSEQVLTARVGVKPELDIDGNLLAQRVDEMIDMNMELQDNMETRQQLFKQFFDETRTKLLTIQPGEQKEYVFKNVRPLSKTLGRTVSPGDVIDLPDPVKTPFDIIVTDEAGERRFAPGVHYLPERIGSQQDARLRILPASEQDKAEYGIKPGQNLRIRYFPANALTFRFKIHSGSNDPGTTFRITIGVANSPFYEVREVALVQTQTMLIPAGAVTDDGTLTIAIVNGDIETQTAIDASINFPPDGLEVMYKVSDFEPNYVRAMLIHWLKLGFLAMLGIAAATFASFPVACLLAFCIFFGAQTGPFLAESIEFYKTIDLQTKQTIWSKWLILQVARGVHFLLQGFGDIRPTDRLIDGRNIAWREVGTTFLMITLLWTGMTGVVGWAIFRRRQLAIYSGHS